MFASGETAPVITSAASWISLIAILSPPATENSTPRAPSIFTSISGDSIACCAAKVARFSPDARPIPISAEPAFFITAFTSAKSRLIRACSVINSEIPCTPCRSTSSAIRKVSKSGVRGSIVCSNRSFGIVINASTWRDKFSIASSAFWRRFAPSNVNGFVATPTVRISLFRASSATIGPAPEPVPPPAPSVINTISAPSSDFAIASRASSAAARPFSGSPPAPKP